MNTQYPLVYGFLNDLNLTSYTTSNSFICLIISSILENIDEYERHFESLLKKDGYIYVQKSQKVNPHLFCKPIELTAQVESVQ